MGQVFDVLRNFFPGFVFHVLKYDNANLVLLANVIFKRFLFCSVTQSYLFTTPWTVASQASLSFTISWSLLQLMSIESVMPSNHLILCNPLLLLPSIFPSIRSFPTSRLFTSGGQSIGASASVLPMNIQG